MPFELNITSCTLYKFKERRHIQLLIYCTGSMPKAWLMRGFQQQ